MSFLLFLAYHSTSCLYGTFLFNNEKERKTFNYLDTMSIWSDVLENIEKYKNPFYDSNGITSHSLNVNFCPFKMRFWEEYFLKYNFSYATSVDIENSFNKKVNINTKNSHYYEINKKEDKILIESQKQYIDGLKKIIKEIYKLGYINNFSNDLSEESRTHLKKLVDSDSELKYYNNSDDSFLNVESKIKK